jgi:hypothetical protein
MHFSKTDCPKEFIKKKKKLIKIRQTINSPHKTIETLIFELWSLLFGNRKSYNTLKKSQLLICDTVPELLDLI